MSVTRCRIHKLVVPLLALLFCGVGMAQDTLSTTSAQMSLTISGGRATGECALAFSKTGNKPVSCAIFESPLLTTSVNTSEGLAIYRDKALAAIATQPGEYTANISFNLGIHNLGGRREIILPVARAGTCSIKLALPGENTAIKSNAAISVENTPRGTFATVYPGNLEEVRLSLTPGGAHTTGKTHLGVDVSGKINFKDGVVYLSADYSCERLGGEGGSIVLDIPGGWVLDKFSGADVTTWKPLDPVEGKLPSAYTVNYSTGGKLKFSLLCTKVAGFGKFILPLKLPMPREAVRAEGKVSLLSSRRASLSVDKLAGARPSEAGFSITSPEVAFTLKSQPGRFLYTSSMQTDSVVHEHVMNVNGRLQINVREGGSYQLPLAASSGLRINSLKAGGDVRWHQEGGKVVVDFVQRLEGRVLIEFSGELSPDKGSYPVPWLLPSGASQQTVLSAFRAPEGYEIIRSGTLGNLLQVDNSSLPGWMRGAQYALQGEKIPVGMKLALRKSPPSVEALCALKVKVEPQRMLLNGFVNVMPKSKSLFRHRVFIGRDMEVSKVSGGMIRDWDYSAHTGFLQVTLSSSCPSSYIFTFSASTAVAGKMADFALPYYEGATLMRGYCLFSPSAGTGISVAKSSLLIPCSYNEMKQNDPQTVRFIGKPYAGELLTSYTSDKAVAKLSRRDIPADLRLEERCMVDFSPGMALFTAVMDFNILRGGLDGLVFRVPPGFSNVEISCTGKPSSPGYFRPEDVWQDKDGSFRISYPSRLQKLPQIIISCEKVLPVSGEVSISPVEVTGCERVRGTLSVYKPEGAEGAFIDIQEKGRDGFDRKLNTAPVAFKAAGKNLLGDYTFEVGSAVLGFGISSTGSRILQAAKASECELASRLTDSGNLLTRLRCRVENPAGQQFMAVTMPHDAKVWGTFANGEAVKVVEDIKGGHLLVPLSQRTDYNSKDFNLDLIYEQKMSAAGIGLAGMTLDTPLLSDPGAREMMQVDRTVWKLWVPGDYELVSSGGTLNLVNGHKAGSSYLLGFMRDVFWGLLGLSYAALKYILIGLLKILGKLLPFILIGLVIYLIWRAVRGGGGKSRALSSSMAVVLLIVLVVIVFSAMLSGPLMSARTSALRASSAGNLKCIGTAIFQYSSPSYYNTPPMSLDDLFSTGLLDSHKSVEIPMGGHYAFCGVMPNIRPGDIVAVEILDDPSEGFANVLYHDNHVKYLKNEEIISNLQKSQNYALLNQFVDNLQQDKYARKSNDWNWGKKEKKIASIGREARELQIAQEDILVNQAQQTDNALSADIQSANDFNRMQALNAPASQMSLKDVERANIKSFSRRSGVRSLLRESMPQKKTGERFESISDSLDGSVVAMKNEALGDNSENINEESRLKKKQSENPVFKEIPDRIINRKISDSSADEERISRPRSDKDKIKGKLELRKSRVSVKSAKGKLSADAAEQKAKEFQKEWLQSQSVELKEDEKPVGRLNVDKSLPEITKSGEAGVQVETNVEIGTGETFLAEDKQQQSPQSIERIPDVPGLSTKPNLSALRPKSASGVEELPPLSSAIPAPPPPAAAPAFGEGRSSTEPVAGAAAVAEESAASVSTMSERIYMPKTEATSGLQAVGKDEKEIVRIGGIAEVPMTKSTGAESLGRVVGTPKPSVKDDKIRDYSSDGPVADGWDLDVKEAYILPRAVTMPAVATGALPINVDIPQNGAFLEFSRGAASGGAELTLFFFSRGLSIAFELLIALLLTVALVWLSRHRDRFIIPFCGLIAVISLVSMQWAQSSYKPHLMVALVVVLIAMALKASGMLRAAIRSKYGRPYSCADNV